MMEYAFCVVLGFLLGAIFGNVPRRPKQQVREPTEEEKRRAEKTLREYRNFMTYDGFSSHDGE